MRTRSFATLMIGCVGVAQASPGLGLKADPIGPAGASGSGGVGLMALLQMLVALGIVMVVLKWALPKFANTFNKRLAPSMGSSIKVEESAAFAGGNLYLVAVRNRSLLLSVSQSGVQCLADVTDPKAAPAEPAFMDLLETAKTTPTKAAVVIDEPAVEPSPDEIAEALRRLERLAG